MIRDFFGCSANNAQTMLSVDDETPHDAIRVAFAQKEHDLRAFGGTDPITWREVKGNAVNMAEPAFDWQEAFGGQPAYQRRVIDEKAELDAKHMELEAFINGDDFGDLPEEDRQLLREQSLTMGTYSRILSERIARF